MEEISEAAAQTALDLKSLTAKGTKPRKKKALLDLLHALGDMGFSYKRSAVPLNERSVHSWFMKVFYVVPVVNFAEMQNAPLLSTQGPS